MTGTRWTVAGLSAALTIVAGQEADSRDRHLPRPMLPSRRRSCHSFLCCRTDCCQRSCKAAGRGRPGCCSCGWGCRRCSAISRGRPQGRDA